MIVLCRLVHHDNSTTAGPEKLGNGRGMGGFSIWHWMIVLIIVMLVFGTKKLRNIGADLGGAVKGFKEGIKESETVDEAADKPLQHIS